MPMPLLSPGFELDPGLWAGPALIREIGLTTAVIVLSALQGAMLATRCRVLALLPVVCVNLIVVLAAFAASHSRDLALLATLMAASAIAIQFGYLADQVRARARYHR